MELVFGIGLIVLVVVFIVLMAVEYIEYRRYREASAAVIAMGAAIQQSWIESRGQLIEVMSAQNALAEDSNAKAELIHLLNLRLEGLDVIVQSYGEVLNMKVLSALMKGGGDESDSSREVRGA